MFSLQKKSFFYKCLFYRMIEVKKATGKSWNFTSFIKKLKIQNKKIDFKAVYNNSKFSIWRLLELLLVFFAKYGASKLKIASF